MVKRRDPVVEQVDHGDGFGDRAPPDLRQPRGPPVAPSHGSAWLRRGSAGGLAGLREQHAPPRASACRRVVAAGQGVAATRRASAGGRPPRRPGASTRTGGRPSGSRGRWRRRRRRGRRRARSCATALMFSGPGSGAPIGRRLARSHSRTWPSRAGRHERPAVGADVDARDEAGVREERGAERLASRAPRRAARGRPGCPRAAGARRARSARTSGRCRRRAAARGAGGSARRTRRSCRRTTETATRRPSGLMACVAGGEPSSGIGGPSGRPAARVPQAQRAVEPAVLATIRPSALVVGVKTRSRWPAQRARRRGRCARRRARGSRRRRSTTSVPRGPNAGA